MKFVTLDLIEKMVKGIASKTAPNVHTHGDGDITDLDASKLTGKISADRLPNDLDISNTTVSFTSSDTADTDASAWTSVAALTSGEKQSSIFAKVSQMFKNIRYLNKLIGPANGIYNTNSGIVTYAIAEIARSLPRAANDTGWFSDALEIDATDPLSEANDPCLIGAAAGNTKSRNQPDDLLWGIREVIWSSEDQIIVRITGVGTDGKSAIWTRAYTGTWESEWRRYATTDDSNNTKTIQTLTATVNVLQTPQIGSTSVTFAKPFTNPPFVFVSPTYNASITAMHISNITTEGFTIGLQGNSQATPSMQFLIVGD